VSRGVFADLEKLSSLTYGQLLEMQGLGAKSVIQFGLRAETVRTSEPAISAEVPAELNSGTVEALRRVASADWADLISGSDPRFSDIVPNSGDSIATMVEALLASLEPVDGSGRSRISVTNQLPTFMTDPVSLAAWVKAIESRVSRLESLTLEASLIELFEHFTGLKGPRRDALLARFGWSGAPPRTLEEAGRLVSVTRERIRQIESRVRKKLPTTPTYVPALMRALQFLADAAPIEVDKVPSALQGVGNTRVAFAAESVIAAASDLHIDTPILIAVARGVRLVTRAANTAHVSAILITARKKAGASGVVSANDVAVAVSHRSKVECSPEDVMRTLAASTRFRNICGTWFWVTDLPERRNRLVNVCRSMLSVTSPISVSCLRDGIRREYTFRNLSGSGKFDLRVPPAEVLRAFLGDHPDFMVDVDDRVSSTRPLDYRSQLGPSDRTIVDVLRSTPSGVLDRATIIAECVERGINVQTVNVDLTYSCLLEHIDTNIWTLRGSDVNPSAIEALRQANALRPRETRVRDFGWTANGNLWVAAVVPPITQPFVFNCPPGSRSYLAGHKFRAVMQDGMPCGTLGVTDDGTVYGFNAFQQLSNCDPGDIAVVEFSLSESHATLVVGNEELIDLYAPE
jgi:hypothetical protein